MKGILLTLYQDLLEDNSAGFLCEYLTSVIRLLQYHPSPSTPPLPLQSSSESPLQESLHYRMADTHSNIAECPVIFSAEVTDIEASC